MFFITRQELINNLLLINARACAYTLPPMTGEPVRVASRCDCKYGSRDAPDLIGLGRASSGEQTGCPELRTVRNLLEKMTNAEYSVIMERLT